MTHAFQYTQTRLRILDAGSIPGFPANLRSGPVAAMGSARRLIFTTRWHIYDEYSSRRINTYATIMCRKMVAESLTCIGANSYSAVIFPYMYVDTEISRAQNATCTFELFLCD